MDIERLQQALVAADSAGDELAARDLAQALRSALRSAEAQSEIRRNPGEYDPESPAFEKRYGATSSMSNMDQLRAGAGKAFFDVGRGVKQLTGNLSREEVDERKAMDAPLMRTGAGIAGNIGGNVALASAIPATNTYTGAAALGAGFGALQPVGTQDSRIGNAAMGAGGAMGGKYLSDRLINLFSRQPASVQQATGSGSQATGVAGAQASATPGVASSGASVSGNLNARATGGGSGFGTVGEDVSAGLTRAQREIMARGQQMGFRMTPGQASGSRALQQMEAKLESQPMTSGPFNTIRDNNSQILNRAVAQSIGERASVVDNEVMDRAATRLSEVFQDAGDDVARQIDPQQFVQQFQTIQDDVRGLVSGIGEHPLVEDLTKFATQGQASGRQLQSLTSKLGKAAYKQMTSQSGDRDLGLALYRFKDYVDDLLMQGMSQERAQTFANARTQYRNLINLTSRVGIVNPSTGNVSGKSLANLLQQKDKAGFMYGRNQTPMYEAARFAQAFGPIVGDSGTATRSMINSPLDLMMSTPFNLATRAYTSSPAVNVAAGAGAATQAASQAASRILGPVLGPPSRLTPYFLPEAGGVLGTYAAGQ